jgi:protein tyrosine phosphatase (PTP) superfamily phosphohydrolase (DUF442 family)
MKTTLLLFTTLFIGISCFASSSKGEEAVSREFNPDSLILINQEIHLYKCADFYFGGWPPLEALQFLESDGVVTVINLRSEKEMVDFDTTMYKEDSICHGLGMRYISIPIAGAKDYTSEKLASFCKAVSENDGKIFIHCYSAGRVMYLMMAWMVQEEGYTLDEALEFGKRMMYYNPLEGLLNKKITFEYKE